MTEPANHHSTRRRLTIILLTACGLMLAATVAIWFFGDEAPLDYSAMDIELGPQDPEINGYSYLREVSQVYRFDLGRFDSSHPDWDPDTYLESDPFHPGHANITETDINELMTINQAIMDAIQPAFSREIFRFDLEPTVDVNIPELGMLQNYVDLRLIQAKSLADQNQPEAGFALAIETANQMGRYADARGHLVNLLTAMGCLRNCNNMIAYLLGHYPLSASSIREGLHDYQASESARQSLIAAHKLEFQMSRDYVRVVKDPQILANLLNSEGLTAQLIALTFKPNRTLNRVYPVHLDLLNQAERPIKERSEVTSMALIKEVDSTSLLASILGGNLGGDEVTELLIPHYGRLYTQLANVEWQSRSTRLYLALRLYQLDHGQLPPTLDSLTPDYITAIPLDPFDGEPIRYDPKRGILYSLGNDFIDHGGSAYPSRFDADTPHFAEAYEADEIAELDENDPTFHIRFDQQAVTAEAN